MDDTLCSLMPTWCETFNTRFGYKDGKAYTPEMFKEFNMINIVGEEDYEKFNYILFNSNIFEHLPPMNRNTLRIMYHLNLFNDVFLVTHAMNCDSNIVYGKTQWVKHNLPFLDINKQLIFTGAKHLINADIMIDDGVHNLENFEGIKILFKRPWNEKDEPKFKYHKFRFVVSSWDQILGIMQAIDRIIISEGIRKCRENVI
jgi:5'(3')-deoxyribonucleotidase